MVPEIPKGEIVTMTMFKPVQEGSWWVSSKSDSRWDCQGSGSVGGFMCPTTATAAIEKKKKELGEEPPDDLEFGYMKD